MSYKLINKPYTVNNFLQVSVNNYEEPLLNKNNIKIPHIDIFHDKISYSIIPHVINNKLFLKIRYLNNSFNTGWYTPFFIIIKSTKWRKKIHIPSSNKNLLIISLDIDLDGLTYVNFNKQKIPKIICQTHETNTLPFLTKQCFDIVRDWNPDYEWIFFTDEDRRNYINKYLDKKYLYTYDSLIPGAFRADVFRYAYLYKNGGIYVDSKIVCLKSFSDYIRPNDELLLMNEFKSFNHIANNMMFSIPNINIFGDILEKIYMNVLLRNYDNVFNITGPKLLRTCCEKIVKNLPDNPQNVTRICQDWRFVKNKIAPSYICELSNDYIIYSCYKNYYNEGNYSNNSYHALFKQRKIYDYSVILSNYKN